MSHISVANIFAKQKVRKPRGIIYGPHGVGKTSLCASAEDPVFIQTEDGLGMIEAPTFGLMKTFDDVMQAIGSLLTDEHDRKTVVIDSIDWLEPMVWAQACKDNGWANIETPGFGKGYVAGLDLWRVLFDGLNSLRDERGMTVLMIAHCDIKRFDSPETEPYDRYVIKLHPRASALVQEHVDFVFFANYRVSTVKSDTGFGKKIVRAVGGSDRVLYTTERPAFLAKNRYAMPESIPMEWGAIATAIPPLSIETHE
jgi:hypothetical protein